MKHEILKVLVGSKAHGTADEYSDSDYRAVHIVPTSEIVGRDFKYKGVSWVEGETEDQTSYELKEFINLAIKGHPNILEILVAPVVSSNNDGDRLRRLFPHIWTPNNVYRSFLNYANNRRKNIFNAENAHVAIKSEYCAIRVLMNLCELLENKKFTLDIKDEIYRDLLLCIKKGDVSKGSVIDIYDVIEGQAEYLLKHCKHEPDLEKIERFYLNLRKKYWV